MFRLTNATPIILSDRFVVTLSDVSCLRGNTKLLILASPTFNFYGGVVAVPGVRVGALLLGVEPWKVRQQRSPAKIRPINNNWSIFDVINPGEQGWEGASEHLIRRIIENTAKTHVNVDT
jgi:hypothetical protein